MLSRVIRKDKIKCNPHRKTKTGDLWSIASIVG